MDVSNDWIIKVDSSDRELGRVAKLGCHQGRGVLHRAFSIHIFNHKGQVLLQKRSNEKLLWPAFWSNSCCSHPRYEEEIESATVRRLKEELNLNCGLKFLYKFEYQAAYTEELAENELCHVFFGVTDEKPVINHHEISEIQYVDFDNLQNMISNSASEFTPWFKLQWSEITGKYKDKIFDNL